MAKKDSSLESILAKYAAEAKIEFVTSGSIAVDAILGGGISLGSMYAFWGPRGSGKSTVAVQCVKQFCKSGLKVAFIDVEKAFNQNQQVAFGVREFVENGSLLYLTADNYVQVDEICTALAEESDVKLVVIDSETMLLPTYGKDVSVDSQQPGQKSRQASVLLTKTKSAFYRKGISSIWLFHARANITMTANPYTPAEKMAGGFSQQHIPDCILKITAGQKIGDKGNPEGQVIHLETEKNKFTRPFQKLDTELIFGKGTSKKREVIMFALSQGIIEQSGAYFKLPNGETVRGTSALYELSNSDLKAIMESLKPLISD